MRPDRLDELGMLGEHDRGFEHSGVTGQASGKVGVFGDEGVPGDGPVASRRDADRVLESEIAGDELDQFLVATMSIQEKDAAVAVANQ